MRQYIIRNLSISFFPFFEQNFRFLNISKYLVNSEIPENNYHLSGSVFEHGTILCCIWLPINHIYLDTLLNFDKKIFAQSLTCFLTFFRFRFCFVRKFGARHPLSSLEIQFLRILTLIKLWRLGATNPIETSDSNLVLDLSAD